MRLKAGRAAYVAASPRRRAAWRSCSSIRSWSANSSAGTGLRRRKTALRHGCTLLRCVMSRARDQKQSMQEGHVAGARPPSVASTGATRARTGCLHPCFLEAWLLRARCACMGVSLSEGGGPGCATSPTLTPFNPHRWRICLLVAGLIYPVAGLMGTDKASPLKLAKLGIL